MKILSASQMRSWDEYTITNEPVTPLDLMERAATACVNWLLAEGFTENKFVIFCGKGNNGGDGLAIARLLYSKNIPVAVHLIDSGQEASNEFRANLARLNAVPVPLTISSVKELPLLGETDIIIDALFGSGLNRPLESLSAELVRHLNMSGRPIISIDIPSGIFADRVSKDNLVIHATHTLSFQCYKPAFLFLENARAIGHIHILDIGLHPGYKSQVKNRFELLDSSIISKLYKPRNRFAHKGNFGHALLVAGSYGKIGAAVLSASACLRSGVGLLTCHIPACGYTPLQTAVPEAMVITDPERDQITMVVDDPSKYHAIGIGPGLGTAPQTIDAFHGLLEVYKKPMVLDADALNMLSMHSDLLDLIPAGSVLTPHPKEFERLFGPTANDQERMELAINKANEHQCVIIVKGHHSFIAASSNLVPPGIDTVEGYFNNTGNAGMATAGSGDVLTGIITGLLALGYNSTAAAILGVWLHGAAGDLAKNKYSTEAMIASDITLSLGEAFKSIGPH